MSNPQNNQQIIHAIEALLNQLANSNQALPDSTLKRLPLIIDYWDKKITDPALKAKLEMGSQACQSALMQKNTWLQQYSNVERALKDLFGDECIKAHPFVKGFSFDYLVEPHNILIKIDPKFATQNQKWISDWVEHGNDPHQVVHIPKHEVDGKASIEVLSSLKKYIPAAVLAENTGDEQATLPNRYSLFSSNTQAGQQTPTVNAATEMEQPKYNSSSR